MQQHSPKCPVAQMPVRQPKANSKVGLALYFPQEASTKLGEDGQSERGLSQAGEQGVGGVGLQAALWGGGVG